MSTGFNTKAIRDLKSKKGVEIKKGDTVVVKWLPENYNKSYIYKANTDERIAVPTQALHICVSGVRKAPSMSQLEKQSDNGIVTTVAGKKAEPDGTDSYGSPAWTLVLGVV